MILKPRRFETIRMVSSLQNHIEIIGWDWMSGTIVVQKQSTTTRALGRGSHGMAGAALSSSSPLSSEIQIIHFETGPNFPLLGHHAEILMSGLSICI